MGPLLLSGRTFLRGFIYSAWTLIPAGIEGISLVYNRVIKLWLPADWQRGIGVFPESWFPWLLWGGITAAVFLTFHKVGVRKDELENRLEPRLEIVLGDRRPYVQEQVRLENTIRQRVYRVGIRNLSDVVIRDVRLVLEDCEPGQELIYPEHMLGVMDHTPSPGRARHSS